MIEEMTHLDITIGWSVMYFIAAVVSLLFIVTAITSLKEKSLGGFFVAGAIGVTLLVIGVNGFQAERDNSKKGLAAAVEELGFRPADGDNIDDLYQKASSRDQRTFTAVSIKNPECYGRFTVVTRSLIVTHDCNVEEPVTEESVVEESVVEEPVVEESIAEELIEESN